MLIEHNPRSFLTGDDPFLPCRVVDASQGHFCGEISFEPRHEGFIGIPHGGLPMGLCLDAWRRSDRFTYPVQVRFRFGGSGMTIGASATFVAEYAADDGNPRLLARLTKEGDKTPYLRAEIVPATAPVGQDWMTGPPAKDFRELPYYRNCFVCGHHRVVTGLQRRFRVHESNGATIITVPWGSETGDRDRAAHFLIGKNELHPAVLVSIFDENTAWAGFMETRSAGLSVRLELTLLRPVAADEPLLFVGRPAGIRGNPRAPRFFLAEGTIYSVTDPGNPEVVAYGKGEWIVMDLYTAQIKKNLLPTEDWAWIFG